MIRKDRSTIEGSSKRFGGPAKDPKLTRQQQRRHQGEPDANLTALKGILNVNKHCHI